MITTTKKKDGIWKNVKFDVQNPDWGASAIKNDLLKK